jgi:hypothetical protein
VPFAQVSQEPRRAKSPPLHWSPPHARVPSRREPASNQQPPETRSSPRH